MRVIILFLLFTLTKAYVVTWDKGWEMFSSATGAAATKCPSTPGEALLERNKDNLLECSEKTLRHYYRANTCCYINLAECNYIERAWWMSVDVLKHKPLCNYLRKPIHPEHNKHYKKRAFLKRLRLRSYGKVK